MVQSAADIVDELIAFDSSLEGKRAELLSSVETMLHARPDTGFREGFQRELLSKLQNQFLTSSPNSFMNKFLYTLGGAVVAGVAVFVVMSEPWKDGAAVSESNSYSSSSVQVAMGDQAEKADESPTASPRMEGGGGGPPMPPYGMGVGGGGAAGGGMATDSMMVDPYEYVQLTYSYDGEIKLPESANVTVLERRFREAIADPGILDDSFANGLMDVDSIPGLKVQSVSLRQTAYEPYNVQIDFQYGSVGINKEFDYSKRPGAGCMDQACYDRTRMKESDMPSDQKLVDIANSFMKQYGIDTSDYGSPVVQDDWKDMYLRSTDKAGYWFPEMLNVVYPYRINGVEVYDEWGNLQGVSVSVDLREMEVSGVWGLQTMEMNSSEYAAVKDEAKFREVLRKGSVNAWLDPAAKTAVAQLGDPKQAYLLHYTWDPVTGVGQNLFVPALVFPVKSFPPESQEYRRAVVVSLADKLLESNQPMPMPTPMFEEGVMMDPKDVKQVEGMEPTGDGYED